VTSPAPAEPSQPLTGAERVAAIPAGTETARTPRQSIRALAGTVPDTGGADSPEGPSLDELIRAFLDRAEKNLGPLRELIQMTCQTKDETARQEMLADFYLRLDPLTPTVDFREGHPALRLCGALQGLVKKLLEEPRHCTSSTLFTVATAVDLLKDLCSPGVKQDLASSPPIRLLVVDDELIARRAITCALQMTFKRPESVDSGEAAVAMATEKPFDVIFMDVRMPSMDGFTACMKIHETVQNRTTPVVFVTNFDDFKTRSQSAVSGGSDLMGKPFVTAEITVKALSFALRSRLQKLKPA
jgi:CheY-like chemotaxis protein